MQIATPPGRGFNSTDFPLWFVRRSQGLLPPEGRARFIAPGRKNENELWLFSHWRCQILRNERKIFSPVVLRERSCLFHERSRIWALRCGRYDVGLDFERIVLCDYFLTAQRSFLWQLLRLQVSLLAKGRPRLLM